MEQTSIEQEFSQLQEYLAEHGETPTFFLKKASLLTKIGEYCQAEQLLHSLTEENPAFFDAWYQLGETYLSANNLERSLLSFATAANLLRQAGDMPNYNTLVQAVLNMDGLPENGALFFQTLLSAQRHTFIFVGIAPFQREMVQRYQSMAIALSELGQDVIYVNPLQSVQTDNSSRYSMLRAMEQNKHTDGRIVVYSLYPHPQAPGILLEDLGARYPDAIFLISTPDYGTSLINLCLSHTVIYDIADDSSDFESAYWTSMQRYQNERQIASVSSAVLTSGAALFLRNYCLEHHANTYLVPNGVDQMEFSCSAAEEPDDLAAIPHPRIGYVGCIYQRFDRELFYQLARDNPSWSFVVVGPILDNYVTKQYPNIYLLGAKSHHELSRYYHGFDVGIIPYRDDAKMSLSCDPVKLYEHICCNLPTVTSYMPDTYLGKPLTWHANSPADVQAAIQHILAQQPKLSAIERSDFLFSNSWLVRCGTLLRIVEHAQQPCDRPETTLQALQKTFAGHRTEHLNLERMYAFSRMNEDFSLFTQCFSHTVKAHELSFDRDMQNAAKVERANREVIQSIQLWRQTPQSKILLLVGYFGHNNFGDELLLDVLLQQLKQQSNLHPIAAGFGTPDHTQALHHVPSISLQDEAMVQQVVSQSDMILLGPGGLLDDRSGIDPQGKLPPIGVYSYLLPMKLAHDAKKPIVSVGLGADPLTTRRATELVQEIFPDIRYLGVRDVYSRDCLAAVGIHHARVSPDLSYLFDPEQLPHPVKTQSPPTLGINLRLCDQQTIQEIVNAASTFFRQGWNLHFIAGQNGVDDPLLMQCVQAYWNSGVPHAKQRVKLIVPASPAETLRAIANVSMLFAMRLHINIMAWQMGVPSLILSYDAKVTSMAQSLGLTEYCVPISDCTASTLQTKAQALWEHRSAAAKEAGQRIAALRADARTAFDELITILQP